MNQVKENKSATIRAYRLQHTHISPIHKLVHGENTEQYTNRDEGRKDVEHSGTVVWVGRMLDRKLKEQKGKCGGWEAILNGGSLIVLQKQRIGLWTFLYPVEESLASGEAVLPQGAEGHLGELSWMGLEFHSKHIWRLKQTRKRVYNSEISSHIIKAYYYKIEKTRFLKTFYRKYERQSILSFS